MSEKIEMLPPSIRVKILSGRLESLKAGKGDYARPEDRTRAINNCAEWLAQAKADMAVLN